MNLTWRQAQVVQDLVSMWDGRLPPRGVSHEELVELYAQVRLLDGAREIAEERIRQQAPEEEGGEGFDEAHDDEQDGGRLVAAAVCYYDMALERDDAAAKHEELLADDHWPYTWDPSGFKPYQKDALGVIDRRRCLVKAGALLEAEMERLQRMRETVLALLAEVTP